MSGRSGGGECIRSCLALLLLSLSLLFLPSSPLSHLSLFCCFCFKKKISWFSEASHFQTFCPNLLQFAICFCSENRLLIFCWKESIFQDPNDTEINTFSLENNDFTNVSRSAQWQIWQRLISALFRLFYILARSDEKLGSSSTHRVVGNCMSLIKTRSFWKQHYISPCYMNCIRFFYFSSKKLAKKTPKMIIPRM